MDTFRSIARRLTFSVIAFLFVLGALFPAPSRASSNPSYDSAWASCLSHIPNPQPNYATISCAVGPISVTTGGTCGSSQQVDEVRTNIQASQGNTNVTCLSSFAFSGPVPPADPCGGMTSTTLNIPGRVLSGYTMSVRGPPDPATGAQAMCQEDLTPVGLPTVNPYDGSWQTLVSAVPTGQVAGEGQGTDGGLYDGSGAASSGGGSPMPDPAPPAPSPPPPICNPASCYSPSSGSYCAQDSSGANIACVSGGSGSSPPSGCGTSGSVTVCTGSPTPPLPNSSTSGVSDPSTQINATGSFTQADSTTGAVGTVTTTVYNSAGGSTSNGSPGATTGAPPTVSSGSGSPASGSTAPASGSTAAGSFAGGTSCTVPPVCSGDAVMCGIARTQWSTTCQLHADLDGPTGKGPASSATSYSQSDVWVTPTTGNTVGDAANAGNYDQSGGGAPQVCPLTDFTFASVHGVTIHLSKGCDPLSWLAYVGLAFALYRAARITAGSAI